MKNSFKLLLVSVFTPLLFGVSFGASDIPGDLKSSYSLGYDECLHNGPSFLLSAFIDRNIVANSQFGCFYVYGPDSSIQQFQTTFQGYINGQMNLNFRGSLPVMFCGNYEYLSNYLNSYVNIDCNRLYQNYYVGFEFYDLSNGGGGDCSSVESELSSCQSDLASCQSKNCDTQLSQCLIDKNSCLDDKSSLSSDLASCQDDNTSYQNYNNSLSQQLNECLGSSVSGNNLSGFYNRYSVFWNDNENMFSLPITNDLFLPLGYKGKLNEDNVLSVAPVNTIENAVSMDDSYFNETVIEGFGVVFIFLFSSGCLLLFVRRFRKFLSFK